MNYRSLIVAVKLPTDLIWLQTGFIGDIVLTTAAISAVQARFPDINQHIITTPVGAKVLAGEKVLRSVAVFDKRGKSFFNASRMVKQDLGKSVANLRTALLLNAHPSTRSALLAKYLGCPSIGYFESALSFLSTYRVQRVGVLHEAHRIGLLTEPLGIERCVVTAARPILTPFALPQKPWAERLEQHRGPVVAIAASSVWATKRWLPEGFAAVARRLIAERGALILCLGSADERSVIEDVLKHIPEQGQVLNLAGVTSFDDLRSIYPKLSLLIAGDSSPIHFAAAFNVPTLAIFGATVPAMGFAPLAQRSRIAQISLSCRPCSDHGPKTCPLTHFRCMREVTDEQVYHLASELLS